MDFNQWNIIWSICFGAIAFMIIIGNCLSIIILLKRRLRKRPHYLLISLAIADLLVGVFAMPIYMIIVMSGNKFVTVLVFDCVDMFTGFSSVFTLVLISMERLSAIAQPLRHRLLTSRSYIFALIIPWILAVVVTSSRLLLQLAIITKQQFLSVIILSLSTPLFLLCLAYCIIMHKEALRPQLGFRARSEARLSKTVCLITGMFILTWMPFQLLVIVIHKCTVCSKSVPVSVVFLIKLLQFSNSVVNFFIYCLRMPVYRRALSALFRSCNCFVSQTQVHPFFRHQNTNVTIISLSSSVSVNRCRQGQSENSESIMDTQINQI